MLTYGFYNSVNHDRQYNAEQMSSMFDGLITDGIFQSVGNHFNVLAGTGMQINVDSGKAWFNHTWTQNDALLPITVTESEVVLTRIDAVAIEINKDDSARENSIKIIKGTPSSQPQRPEMQHTETLNQYALAYITVNPGVTEILQSDIVNNIGTETTPFITGIMQSVDITTLLLQWQSQWENWMSSTEASEADWFSRMQAEFELWATAQRTTFNEWSVEERTEFEIWEATIRNILDQGAAGHLQNEIDSLSNTVNNNRKLVHLHVEVDSSSLLGANVTVTNGSETYTKTVTASITELVFDCINLGTWSITEDLLQTQNSVTCEYYGNYETAIGGGVYINVTYDTEFYGKTLSLTNGTKTYTKYAVSSLSGVTFVVAEHDTWTVSATYDGQIYTASVNCPSDGNYSMNLRVAIYNYEGWLTAANISPDNYDSLAEVLADEAAVRKLFTKHDSVDYIINWATESTAEPTIIFNDYVAAKWINLRDYALDTLHADTICSGLMDAADKYFYGEWINDGTNWKLKGNVPKMVSNTVPYGIASAYQVFDDDPSTSASGTDFYYQFKRPICVRKVECSAEGYTIYGSNDLSNYVSYLSTWTEIEDIDSNENFYMAYKVHFASSTSVTRLQFYGREYKSLVPYLGSTNFLGYISSITGLSAYAFQGFRRNSFGYGGVHGGHLEDIWNTPNGESGTKYVTNILEFPREVIPKFLFSLYMITNYQGSTIASISNRVISLSDDNANWDQKFNISSINDGTQFSDIHDNTTEYKYLKYTWAGTLHGAYPYTAFSAAGVWGVDYSEREDKVWLYDHGVKNDLLTLSSGITEYNDHLHFSTQNDLASMDIDTTNYEYLGANLSGGSSGVTSSIIGNTSVFNIDMAYATFDKAGLDITNLNGSNTCGVKMTNAGYIDVDEIWIE